MSKGMQMFKKLMTTPLPLSLETMKTIHPYAEDCAGLLVFVNLGSVIYLAATFDWHPLAINFLLLVAVGLFELILDSDIRAANTRPARPVAQESFGAWWQRH